MEIRKENNDIELIKDGKHLKISTSGFDNLDVSFSYGDGKDDFWFQESFDVDKNDEDVYKIVDGTFLSYGGDVFFDTYGANLVLLNNEGSYKFLFMKEYSEGSKEIKCRFFDESMENNSMRIMYERLKKLDNVYEKPKTLSKTLNKIVE